MIGTTYATKTLSPRKFAESVGVSESSMKRWIDAGMLRVSRTAGGHRRIPLAEAVRFIREQRMNVIRPDLLGIPELKHGDTVFLPDGLTAERLFDVLLSPQAIQARSMLLGAYLGGISLPELFDGPIRETMQRIGETWMHSDQGIFLERRATNHCIEALNQIRLFVETPEDAPRAVGGAPSGDPYSLPSVMAGLVAAQAGYNETNLGPNIPVDTIAKAAESTGARLVWLSISTENDHPRLREEVETLAATLSDRGMQLAVGGRFAGEIIEPGRQDAVLLGSMEELDAFARSVIAPGA